MSGPSEGQDLGVAPHGDQALGIVAVADLDHLLADDRPHVQVGGASCSVSTR